MPTGSFRLVDLSGSERNALISVDDTDAVIPRSMANAPSRVLPIDVDHGLDGLGAKDGSAAGWITGMTVMGDKIVADVEWTKLGERRKEKVERRVTAAMQAGKLPPALKTWGHALALENPDAFDTFVAGSPLDILTPSGISGNPPQIVSATDKHSSAELIERQPDTARRTL
ncbi:MAG: phage protease [Pseudomonadota bacterium]